MEIVFGSLAFVVLACWAFTLRQLGRTDRKLATVKRTLAETYRDRDGLGTRHDRLIAASARTEAILDGLTLLVERPPDAGVLAQYTLRQLAQLYYAEAPASRSIVVYSASSSHGRIRVELVGPPDPIEPGPPHFTASVPTDNAGRADLPDAQRGGVHPAERLSEPARNLPAPPTIDRVIDAGPEQCGARFTGYVTGDPLGDICDRDAGHDGPHAVSLFAPGWLGGGKS